MNYDDNNTTVGREADPFTDQYADGVASALPQFYSRTPAYKRWLSAVVAGRGCKTILDAACGNGVDSIQLLEEGYDVVSTDYSELMLEEARNERQRRRKDAAFSNWVIGQGNWMTLPEDLRRIGGLPKDGFDIVLCLGNSFPQLPDFEGTKHNQKTALTNLFAAVKPGGVLILDHRNYDDILDEGRYPVQNLYYNSSDCIVDIDVSTTYANSKPIWVTFSYKLLQSALNKGSVENPTEKASRDGQRFRLSYYPYRLADLNSLIEDTLGAKFIQTVYADFKPLGEVQKPSYYAHVIEKSN